MVLLVSYLGLLIIYLVTMLPFCIWQMKRNYDTISLSFEEAAEIDGASAWQTFSRILLPLRTPALAVTGLFSLFMAWNEYVDRRDFPAESLIFRTYQSRQWVSKSSPALPSVALLVSIPAILAFLVLTRFLFTSLPVGAANN